MSSLSNRLNSLGTGNPVVSTAVIGILPTLTSLLNLSEDSSLKVASLACINQIFARFGKTNNDVIFGAAKALIGEIGLGSTNLTIVASSLDCFATAILVLGEGIVPAVPEISIKTIGLLQSIINEELEEEEVHNASYGLFGSLLNRIPWILSGKNLEDLLRVSHGSANAELSLACDQARQKVLDLLAEKVDPKECFAALKRTWQNAVAEGPKVSLGPVNAKTMRY